MEGLGTLMISILLVLATSSSSVQAGYTRYRTQFYETIPPSDVVAFEPKPVANKGTGYVKHNVLKSSAGRPIGTIGGTYFYHSLNIIEDIVTIHFSPKVDWPLGGSSLNLRGRWVMSPDGNDDLSKQELSIVGGQGNLRGAFGSVHYSRTGQNPIVYLITCNIYVHDLFYSIPEIHVDLDSHLNSPDDAVKVQPESQNFPGEALGLDILKEVVDVE